MQQARTPNITATPERAMGSLRVVAPALIIHRGMNHAPLIEKDTELNALAEFISRWLERHPKAISVPVEAYPFFSKTVARIYIWILDGPDSLKMELVCEGFINGD